MLDTDHSQIIDSQKKSAAKKESQGEGILFSFFLSGFGILSEKAEISINLKSERKSSSVHP